MNVEIAQRLAELRRARGYSQETLARELGLSRQAVSKWERAESSPDTDNLIQLAKLYGVSLDELLNVDADVAEDIAYENADKAAGVAGSNAQAQEDAGTAPQEKKRKGPWRSFPYAVAMVILFFLLVFLGYAELSWLVFLTIPIYNWMANILDEAREREDAPVASTDAAKGDE